jgi:hypothetical protein
MGLVVRLYDIVSPNKFKLSIGLSPYGNFDQIVGSEANGYFLPSTTGTTDTTHRNYRTDPICITDNNPEITGSTCSVYESLTFDTRYFLKLEDTSNLVNQCDTNPCIDNTEKRHIIESIYISDSKTFDCYDKIKFDVDYVCLTPTPTPSATPNPTPNPTTLPNPTPNPTPEPTANPTPNPTADPTPQPTPQCLRYIITVTDQKVALVVTYTDCATGLTDTETINPSTSETLCSLTQPVRSSGTLQYYIGEGTDNCANAPTPNPTPNPTANPTPNPTAEPTPEPTPEPTGLCIEVSDFVARTDLSTTFTWEDCDGNSYSMNIPAGDAAPPSSGPCVRQGTVSWVPSGGNARVDLAISPSGLCDGGEPVTTQCYNYTLSVPSMGETTSTFSYTACNGDERTWTGLSGDNTSVCAQDGTVSVTSGPGTYYKGSAC